MRRRFGVCIGANGLAGASLGQDGHFSPLMRSQHKRIFVPSELSKVCDPITAESRGCVNILYVAGGDLLGPRTVTIILPARQKELR